MNIELNLEANELLRSWGRMANRNSPFVDLEMARESVEQEMLELMPDADIDDIHDAMDDAVAGIHHTRIWMVKG